MDLREWPAAARGRELCRGCQPVELINPHNVFTGEKKTVQDALGNTIEVKKKKGHLKGADLKKYQKMKEARRKRGEDVSITESEED